MALGDKYPGEEREGPGENTGGSRGLCLPFPSSLQATETCGGRDAP